MWQFLHKMASPPHFYSLSAKMIPWFYATGVAAVLYGTVAGLFFAPVDEEMNDGFRIIYVHVPAAYISMMAYMVISSGTPRTSRTSDSRRNQRVVRRPARPTAWMARRRFWTAG